MHDRNPILPTAARLVLVATVVLVLAGPPASAQLATGLALAPGEEAPDLIGWGMDQELKTYSYEKRITLVNFWATWCQPCRQEMPTLEALMERFGEAGLQVIGFNQEPAATLDVVKEHLASLGVTYPNMKPDRRWNWGGISTVPTSFMVSPDGIIMRKYIGASPEQLAGLERDIEDALNGRPLQAMILPKPPAPTPSDGK